MIEKTVTTECWCMACMPVSGEIGLKCKKIETPTETYDPDETVKHLAQAIIYPDTDVRRIAIVTHLLKKFSEETKDKALYGG